jgi:hypothetical protein
MDEKRTNCVVNLKHYFFIILMLLIVCMSGCSQDLENTKTDSGTTLKSTGTDPTGPTYDRWETLDTPVLLKDILGFDLKDVTAITVEKYEDSTKTALKNINDVEKISKIANMLSEFSIIHTTEKLPESPLVYELSFSRTTGAQEFMSITSMGNKGEFVVGGSFVGYNNLSPLELLVQNNAKISFDNIQELLE